MPRDSPSKNFFLKLEKSERGSSLYIVNRKALLGVIKENIQYFTGMFGNATEEKIVEDFLGKKASLESIFDDDIVAGIVFGYGLENALLFDRYMRINRALESSDTLLNPSSKVMAPSAGFKSLAEELDSIEKCFLGTPELFGYNYIEAVIPVEFRTLDSPKNQHLLRQYRQVRKELTTIFNSHDMLEKVLKRFVEE